MTKKEMIKIQIPRKFLRLYIITLFVSDGKTYPEPNRFKKKKKILDCVRLTEVFISPKIPKRVIILIK